MTSVFAARMLLFVLLLGSSSPVCSAQSRPDRAGGIKGLTIPDDPEHPGPAAKDFRDRRYGVSFHVAAGWNFERRDGTLSNFGTDVRSARRGLDVRGVAAINFNPYPPTTFAGAMFYYSVMPQSGPGTCVAMATSRPLKAKADVQIAGIAFKHGQDQHGTICTETRDEVFTALRGKSCLRFDLVVNTFCAQSSGAMEITQDELGDVNTRLENMLKSIRIDGR